MPRSGGRPAPGSAWCWAATSGRSPGSATGRCRRSGRRSTAAGPSPAPGRPGSRDTRSRPRPPPWPPRAARGRPGKRTPSTRRPARSSGRCRPGRRLRRRRAARRSAWPAPRCARSACCRPARPGPRRRRSAGRTRGCRYPRTPWSGPSPAGTGAASRTPTRPRGQPSARSASRWLPCACAPGSDRRSAAAARAGRTAPPPPATTGGRAGQAGRTWRNRTGSSR